MGLDEDSQYFQYSMSYVHNTMACLRKAMHCAIDVYMYMYVCIIHCALIHVHTNTCYNTTYWPSPSNQRLL